MEDSYPDYQRGVHDGEIPRDLRLMSGNKLPRGLLCQCLRRKIDYSCWYRGLRLHRFHRSVIPEAFGENTRYRGHFESRHGRRREDHTLQGAPMF